MAGQNVIGGNRTSPGQQTTMLTTIPANPPVSGTLYTNTSGYTIHIYIPAYATTAATAGTVAVALGASTSPPTIFTEFISGSTASTSTAVVQLRVPNGWSWSVTLTGVTLGTATAVID